MIPTRWQAGQCLPIRLSPTAKRSTLHNFVANAKEAELPYMLRNMPSTKPIPPDFRDGTKFQDWVNRHTTKAENGCLEVVAYRAGTYPVIRVSKPKRTQYIASRVAYFVFNGDIPDGALVCHKCDNPRCINPEHLFLGTHQDNLHDAITKGRFDTGLLSRRNRKLTQTEAAEAYQLKQSGWTTTDLAARRGVCRDTMTRYLNEQISAASHNPGLN